MPASLTTFATVVSHTPGWVWVLYAMLFFLGFQRTRDSRIALLRMLILPSVVLGLTISAFWLSGPGVWSWMALAVAAGGTAGWLLEPKGFSRRIGNGRIWLAGEWWTLLQIVLVMIVRYTMSIVPHLDPALAADPVWHAGMPALSAGLSAIFLGRTAARLHFYSTAGAGEPAGA